MHQESPKKEPEPLGQSPQKDDPSSEGSQAVPEPRRVPHKTWTITEELAGDRNRMASERTLMGWIRTSLAMIGFGFGIAKFFEFLRTSQPQRAARFGEGPEFVGEFLLVLGTFLMLGSAIAHWRRLTRIDRGEVTYRSRFSLGLLVAFILFTLGIFAVIVHFFRW
jgi:putative membrane protein